jgi:hypothetical protein
MRMCCSTTRCRTVGIPQNVDYTSRNEQTANSMILNRPPTCCAAEVISRRPWPNGFRQATYTLIDKSASLPTCNLLLQRYGKSECETLDHKHVSLVGSLSRIPSSSPVSILATTLEIRDRRFGLTRCRTVFSNGRLSRQPSLSFLLLQSAAT